MFKDQSQDRSWLQLVVPQKHSSEVLAALHEGGSQWPPGAGKDI